MHASAPSLMPVCLSRPFRHASLQALQTRSALTALAARAQYAESLFKELDYRKEAENGRRFRELYGDLEVIPTVGFQSCWAG